MKKYLFLVIILSFHVGYGQSWVKNYESVDDWSCGLAKVSKDQKVGFVNAQCKLIVGLIAAAFYITHKQQSVTAMRG